MNVVKGGEELVDGGLTQLGVGGVGGTAVGVELDAESAFAGEGESVVGGFSVDEEARAAGILVGDGGSGGVTFFSDDEEEGDLEVGVAEFFCGGNLGGDDALGVAGAAAIEEVGVFAAGAKEGWDGVHVGGEDDVWGDAGESGEDVEAWAAASAGGAGEIGLGDGLAFYIPAQGLKVMRQELACGCFVVGGRFDVDKLAGELDGIDHAR
jgi:hypothetical protein